ncbi:hypothetical protein Pmani_018392 [Petrolisthes manimaculis]|uniref:Uncharacterized protein n=1 Tax=Petrolisthes manimaculis TaxID=1843537 RepID=A0AAE1PKH5_9EUCA|nr:hypothetical protein Pmani_018392 [Petrolisthes manimaculis]
MKEGVNGSGGNPGTKWLLYDNALFLLESKIPQQTTLESNCRPILPDNENDTTAGHVKTDLLFGEENVDENGTIFRDELFLTTTDRQSSTSYDSPTTLQVKEPLPSTSNRPLMVVLADHTTTTHHHNTPGPQASHHSGCQDSDVVQLYKKKNYYYYHCCYYHHHQLM